MKKVENHWCRPKGLKAKCPSSLAWYDSYLIPTRHQSCYPRWYIALVVNNTLWLILSNALDSSKKAENTGEPLFHRMTQSV